MKTFILGGIHPEENKFANHQPVEEFPIPKIATVFYSSEPGCAACVLSK